MAMYRGLPNEHGACPPGEYLNVDGTCHSASEMIAIAPPPSMTIGTRRAILPPGRYQTTDCPSGWSYIGPSVDGITSPLAVCVAPGDLASTPLPGQAEVMSAQASIAQAGASTSKTMMLLAVGLIVAYFLFRRA